MRKIAGFALLMSSLFFILAAVLLNSAALFNMGTATIAMILACRLQAWFAVRGIHISRIQPAPVFAGEDVTIELNVESDHRYKRPLVSIVDDLPMDLEVKDMTPSLPVAPAHDAPVSTHYKFKPLHRGKYSMDTVSVRGTDALGLVLVDKVYRTDPIDLWVLPRPIPFEVELPRGAGWGFNDSDLGKSRGTGLEPRGIREYTEGDSQRFIHWKSSARAGKLLVKEFETGAYSQSFIFLQRSSPRPFVNITAYHFDRMCGHAAYLAEILLRNGSEVLFPIHESGLPQHDSPTRRQEILHLLASVERQSDQSLQEEILSQVHRLAPGSSAYIFVSRLQNELYTAVSQAIAKRIVVTLLVYLVTNQDINRSMLDSLQRVGAKVQFLK